VTPLGKAQPCQEQFRAGSPLSERRSLSASQAAEPPRARPHSTSTAGIGLSYASEHESLAVLKCYREERAKHNGDHHDPPTPDLDVLSEEELQRLKSDPGLRRMIEDSIRDERAGRVFAWSEVKEAMQRGNLQKKLNSERTPVVTQEMRRSSI
jgi:hypothetical protein